MSLDALDGDRAPRHGDHPHRSVARIEFVGKPVLFTAYTDGSPKALARELTRRSAGPPQAAAWTNAVVAERAMSMAIEAYGSQIYSWLRNPGNLPFIRDLTLPFEVGRVLTRADLAIAEAEQREPQVLSTRTFRIELRICPQPPGFFVVHADPLPPLPDHGVSVSPITAYEAASPAEAHTRGHAIARHGVSTIGDAINRLRNEPRTAAAGAFNDVTTLDHVVRTIAATYSTEIAGWLTNSSWQLPLIREMRFAQDVGWVLERDEMERAEAVGRPYTTRKVRGARLVLRKSRDFPEGFYVVTAYPVEA